MTMPETKKSQFEELAVRETSPSIVGEFWEFLSENKKWWLTPIIAVLLLLGLFILFSGTAAAPFIYTLF
jgi:hypothetical protein